VYVNVIVPTSGISSLLIDGTPIDAWEHIPHPNYPNYSVVARRFLGPEGKHTITCDSVFTAINYGLGDYESYGYNAGCLVNNLDGYGGIKNTFNSNGQIDTFSCPKSPVKLMVKLAYPATSITWKLSQVSNILPNTDVVDNTPVQSGTQQINGRTYYLYTLPLDYTFATIGTYKIPISYTAIGIDACNSTDHFTYTVVIKQGPVANFTIPNACPNETINLINSSTNNGFTLANYLWNFPDATTQNTANAIKSFSTVGTYNVRYRIYATNGCVGDTTKPVTVGSPTLLSVQAQGKACIDSVFSFTSSIPSNATNPPSWYWNFGDGTSTTVTTGNTITHSFASIPTTPVRHAVSFTIGCGTDTIPFIIPILKQNPTANFVIKKDTLCANKPILFSSNLTNVNKWFWDFGNGTSNKAPAFYHTYSSSNTYIVTLKIEDNNGCGSLPITDNVTINPSPIVDAGASKSIQLGQSVTLNGTVNPTALYNYLWSPGITLNADNILQPIAKPIATTQYFLLAINTATFCSAKDSVKVSIISNLFVPNAFTPNADTKNDTWLIPALAAYPNCTVNIYNRYGQKIFESIGYKKPWDGNFKGKQLPAGAYVYFINTGDVTIKNVRGTVLLLR
jgi:gliding motility-associated-like protein